MKFPLGKRNGPAQVDNKLLKIVNHPQTEKTVGMFEEVGILGETGTDLTFSASVGSVDREDFEALEREGFCFVAQAGYEVEDQV